MADLDKNKKTETGKTPVKIKKLLPLDGRRWFGRNIINYSIYAFDFIYNAA